MYMYMYVLINNHDRFKSAVCYWWFPTIVNTRTAALYTK